MTVSLHGPSQTHGSQQRGQKTSKSNMTNSHPVPFIRFETKTGPPQDPQGPSTEPLTITAAATGC